MSGDFRVNLGGDGKLDAQLTVIIRDAVEAAIEQDTPPTIGALAQRLGLHPQRASRLVHALGLRDRFSRVGRPGAK